MDSLMSTYEFELFFDAGSEIRLLTILPGSTQDPVACKLEIHQVDSPPSFEALSYTWGDNDAQNPIDIDGHCFIVHGNAYQALLELRNPEAPRTLWIDAVCIDQEDEEEKARQVPLMKSIYGKAERVVVWFPKPRGRGKIILGLLRELHLWGLETATSMIEDKDWHRLKAYDWLALRDFLVHPWWSRVWTLQEVILAREIVFQVDKHTISWDSIVMLGRERKALPNGRYYPRPYDSQPRGRFAISEIEWARSLRKSGLGFSLLDLLLHGWERKATDPRDCIYGLSALASDIEAEELDLNIDYTATVAEVLTDAVNKILLKHGTLELFSNAGLGFPRPLPYLPSYVPNWSNLNVPAKPLYYLFDGGRQTLAPEEKGINLHPCGQLQASAYFLDTVLMVSSGPLTGIQEAPYYQKCLAWLDEAERMSVYGNGQHCAKNPYPLMAPLEGYVSILEAFWRTLVADRSIRWSKAPPFGLHGYLRYKIRLAKACGKPTTTLFVNTNEYGRLYPVPTEDTAVLSEDWINTMRITSYGRSFCLTSAGRIGLVPPGTKPGDGICLLVGGAVPFVMRSYIPTNMPFIQQGVQLQLVGECYIHGVDAVETIKGWRSAAHYKAPHPVLLA